MIKTQHQDGQAKDQEKLKRQQRQEALGRHVLQGLGQPSGLQKVQVRRLWEQHYRVNILVGADAASAHVAHSYFLVVDGEDKILKSTPGIRREY